MSKLPERFEPPTLEAGELGTRVNGPDAGLFEEWRPAIVKPVEECVKHILDDYERQVGGPPPAEGLAESRRRLEIVSGKKVLVRVADHPQFPCSCGAPVAEIERASAEASQPGWRSYGTHRPTICSEMLYVD